MTADAPTTAFYDRYATTAQEATQSGASRYFEAAFAPGARVLDVGCGLGRDVAQLLEAGFDAFGVEPNDAMRAGAAARHPALAGRLAAASLPALGQPFGGSFEGVLCSAVLMHVATQDLPAALAALRAVLAASGRLLLSLPDLRADLLAEGRDGHRRQFTNHAPERAQSLLAPLGLALHGRWDSATGDTAWRVMLFGPP